jgi:hypothetical protein
MMRYTILQGIDVHGIVCDRFTWDPLTWDPLTWDFTMLFLKGTVTVYMDSHEVVYNVNIDENRRFL